MLIPMKDLNNKIPDIQGSNTNLYFLSKDFLAKRFLKCYGIQQRQRLEKYRIANQIKKINGLSLPVDILETEKGFCGYIEPIIPGTCQGELTTFADYINAHQHSITLEIIAKYILNCCHITDGCHECGIVNPDMCSDRNVQYHPNSQNVYFADYQDMQVQDIPANGISSFIAIDSILKNKKYQNNGMYSPNIDFYTLAIRFFYYATKINVPRAIQAYSIQEMIDLAGIANTNFADCLRILYDPNQNNLNPAEAIKELYANYELTPFQQGQVRNLVRK